MRALLDVVFIVLELYIWVLIAQAILSWLLVFNVVNPRNQVVRTIWQLTHAVTEPLLKPIRSVIRPINGLDLAPLILILLIILTRQVLIHYVYFNVV
ncbi:MAG: YggT family protein [Hyphomonadaceae bacterium]